MPEPQTFTPPPELNVDDLKRALGSATDPDEKVKKIQSASTPYRITSPAKGLPAGVQEVFQEAFQVEDDGLYSELIKKIPGLEKAIGQLKTKEAKVLTLREKLQPLQPSWAKERLELRDTIQRLMCTEEAVTEMTKLLFDKEYKALNEALQDAGITDSGKREDLLESFKADARKKEQINRKFMTGAMNELLNRYSQMEKFTRISPDLKAVDPYFTEAGFLQGKGKAAILIHPWFSQDGKSRDNRFVHDPTAWLIIMFLDWYLMPSVAGCKAGILALRDEWVSDNGAVEDFVLHMDSHLGSFSAVERTRYAKVAGTLGIKIDPGKSRDAKTFKDAWEEADKKARKEQGVKLIKSDDSQMQSNRLTEGETATPSGSVPGLAPGSSGEI
jgi:hypothetical protein